MENELMGGNGTENARLAMEILNGKGRKTIKCAVALNTGAILYVAGRAKTLEEGYKTALKAIEDGTALAKVKQIQEVSKELSAA